jgi:hypothetical protein
MLRYLCLSNPVSSSIALALLIPAMVNFAFRPPLRPLALAASKPAFVLSEIKRRSNCAIETIIWDASSPTAVVMSILSLRLINFSCCDLKPSNVQVLGAVLFYHSFFTKDSLAHSIVQCIYLGVFRLIFVTDSCIANFHNHHRNKRYVLFT